MNWGSHGGATSLYTLHQARSLAAFSSAISSSTRSIINDAVVTEQYLEVIHRDADRPVLDPDELRQRPVHRGCHLLLGLLRLLAYPA